jgi:hypothetical protein
MSDETTEPASGLGEPFDQTNGLADGLDGDDGGTVGENGDAEQDGDGRDSGPDDDAPGGVLGAGFRGIADPLRDLDDERSDDADGRTPEDSDEAITPYSEEGGR